MPFAEWKLRSPARSLAGFVDTYIGYRLIGFPPGVHRGLPSRNLTFLIAIGPPVDIASQADSTQLPDSYRSLVAGLHASPALVTHQGHQEGVGVALSPLGARSLFGLPASALWSTSVELADLVGKPGWELWERLQYAEGWNERFTIVENALLGLKSDRATRISPELTRVWHRLVIASGNLSVAALAADVGWSRQHLTRRFSMEFGLPPKAAARVFRFNRAIKMIDGPGPAMALAEIALECGYYDQAHMTNEFVELGGASPGKIFEGEVTNLQDDPVLASAQ